MNLDLTSKRAIVTGGSKGIGFACAKTLLKEGVRLVVSSRSAHNLKKAKSKLDKLGEIHVLQADLSKSDEACEMVKSAKDILGGIDILVNSAGAAKQSPLSQLSSSAWSDAMKAKYFTYIHTIHAVLPIMRKTYCDGAIVNIIGTGGKFPLPFHLAGGAANAALMLTTSGMAGVLGVDKIRINGVNPGYIRTDRLKHIIEAKKQDSGVKNVEEKIVNQIPLSRMGEADDVANLVAFLVSSRASYITGANISIDGGLSLAI